MKQRKRQNDFVLWRKRNVFQETVTVGVELIFVQHHSFGARGGARRVEDNARNRRILGVSDRSLAAVASILVVVAIEAAAREIVFGVLMVNLLFLFLPGKWNERAFLPSLGVYIYLIAAVFGLVPMFTYAI